MSNDKILEKAVREMKEFLEEHEDYNKGNRQPWPNRERGILKHRSLLIIKRLQEWRR